MPVFYILQMYAHPHRFPWKIWHVCKMWCVYLYWGHNAPFWCWSWKKEYNNTCQLINAYTVLGCDICRQLTWCHFHYQHYSIMYFIITGISIALSLPALSETRGCQSETDYPVLMCGLCRCFLWYCHWCLHHGIGVMV